MVLGLNANPSSPDVGETLQGCREHLSWLVLNPLLLSSLSQHPW